MHLDVRPVHMTWVLADELGKHTSSTLGVKSFAMLFNGDAQFTYRVEPLLRTAGIYLCWIIQEENRRGVAEREGQVKDSIHGGTLGEDIAVT